MAKLVKIIAASVGGGLVLGAGIRLGEAIATWQPSGESASSNKLAERLGTLEVRLQQLEGNGSAAPMAGALSGEHGASFLDWATEPKGDRLHDPDPAANLRNELKTWIEENVSTRMAEVEVRLRAETERGQQQMLDAFVESVQTRVIQRISDLEGEVAGQSAAMQELRECSLRTEQSVQKLLGGLDRLIVKQTNETAPSQEPARSAAPSPPPIPAGQPLAAVTSERHESVPRRSGWKIFG